MPSRVLLLTRTGCHLCEEAESAVAAVCEEVGASWRLVDVDTDANLRAHWTDHVPVTFVDGELHGRWFVEPDRLKQALATGVPDPMPVDWLPSASGPR
ncbi:glutaredoxin family protein [Tessaracoccus rhinocerotis]|uniref:Glutaredoxin family protein n=1 Tax=Tessaracoccus rhinocerotis TaxID=1689449 RepID=A0A553K1K6_9ACTN|nr:glutaredoxin family protein [Tessaracoccus rhinocerotis]TRY18586.1 glutaredoxin family protein [Tessaracoccus rhinocerotis]